jgi:hypothetical protein
MNYELNNDKPFEDEKYDTLFYSNETVDNPFNQTLTGCFLRKEHFEGLSDIGKEVQPEGYQTIEHSVEEISDALVELKIYKPVVE